MSYSDTKYIIQNLLFFFSFKIIKNSAIPHWVFLHENTIYLSSLIKLIFLRASFLSSTFTKVISIEIEQRKRRRRRDICHVYIQAALEMISDATISKWAHFHFMDHKWHKPTRYETFKRYLNWILCYHAFDIIKQELQLNMLIEFFTIFQKSTLVMIKVKLCMIKVISILFVILYNLRNIVEYIIQYFYVIL